MTVRSPRLRDRNRFVDRGFTMIELVIAITLSLLIGGVIVAALVTSLNVAKATTEQVGDSADAGLIASFLLRDAQSAGGIDPATARADVTLGVSTDPADAAARACRIDPSVVRFSWIERSAAVETKFVVSYAKITDPQDATKQQLVRRLCTYGGSSPATVDVVLGRNVLQTEAKCQPLPTPPAFCTGHPDSITLTVTGKGTRAPLVSVLTASLRSAASQLTIIGPDVLPTGQLNAVYPSIFMSTIGATPPTAWSVAGLPAGLSIDANGVIKGTPQAWGPFTVTITALDAASARATKVYSLLVQAPPVGATDAYTLDEDTTLTVQATNGVLKNDTNGNGTPATVAVLYTGVANGALTFTSDGSFIYTPRSNFFGTDSFQYKAKDGALVSNIVTVTLTVNETNDKPVITFPVPQETPKNTNKVFSNSSAISISDVDGPPTQQVRLTSTNGKATLSTVAGLALKAGANGSADMTYNGTVAAINAALANLTFTPTTSFTGAASLRIRANDLFAGAGGNGTDDRTVAINVTNLGIFTDHLNIGTVPASGTDSSYTAPNYTVKGSGWDIWEANDGFQFLYRPLTGDGSLTARILSEAIVYSGASDQNPTCWAADNSHQQPCISVSKAGVMLRQNLTEISAIHAATNVTQGNGSEFIFRKTARAGTGASGSGDSVHVPYWVRITRTGDIVVGEISSDGINWVARGTPQTVTIGSTIYIGLATSAVYQLDSSSNQRIKLNTATFDNVSISTPPTAAPESYEVNEDTTLTVPAAGGVLANDSDPEGTALSAVLVAGTPGLTLNPDGSFTYLPPADFSGVVSFTYMADDNIFNSAPVTVTLTVFPSNEAPSFTAGANQQVESNLGPQTVAGWATAISQGNGETDQLVDFIVTNTNNALFSVQPTVKVDGTLSYAPAVGVSGAATVSVSIHDNGGTANGGIDTSVAQTFTIIVDNAPVVATTGSAMSYIENGTTLLDPGITVTDADSTNLTAAAVAMTTNYVNGEDTLAFVNQNGITGVWTAATGALTLNGSSSVANYEAALRSITYNNTSHNPSTAPRTVAFVASDGLLDSTVVNRTITITAVNDTPVVTATAGTMAYTENGTTAVDPAITVTDADSVNLSSATVTMTTNYLNGQDTLGFTTQNGITGSWSASGVLTLSGSSTVANYQAALRSITYNNNSNSPNTAIRTVTFVVSDGVASSAVATRTITIAAVNDAPVVTATAGSMAYTENATTVLDPTVTVTDPDSTNLSSATVTMTTAYVNGQDTLALATQNGITATWTAATGVLALTGNTTIANYQTALRSITYNNSSDNPTTTTRTVTFVANDGLASGAATSRTITLTAVNDAPVVTATVAAMAYTENGTTALDPGITVADVDSANLSSATVTMTTNYVNGEDTLAVATQNGITGTWNASTGILTLSGSSTVANYQTALRSVTYNDNSHAPNVSVRTVTFIVNDGILDSNTSSRTIAVAAVNDGPVNGVPATQTTAKNVAEVFSSANNSLISISDLDAATNSVQVQLVSTNGVTTLSGIAGLTFSAGDGTADATMMFTGTIGNINAALAGLSFNPTTNFTGAASLKIVTNDLGNTGSGGTLSDTDTVTITVANAPVVTTTVATLPYTENNTTVLDGGILVSDADLGNLASATVTMTSNYVNGQDTLSFTNLTGITGTWNPSTGVMTLSGSATIANYQAAMRSIKYNNNSDSPDTTIRTVTFKVNDGALDSNTASRTITLTAVNDAPVVTATTGTMAYTENATTALDPTITLTDVDSANMSSATISMTANKVVAQDVLTFVNQNGITGTFTASTGVLVLSGSAPVADYQAALRSITYTNNSDNPTTTTRTFTVVVSDGVANSNTASRTITLTAVNDAPVVTTSGTSMAYTENATTAVDSAATVSDVDNTNMTSATVTMTAGYVNGQDTLAFTNANGITGTWTASTGTMTLSGSATVAFYNTALRSITYNNNSNSPDTTARTVTFKVNDGALDSNVASRTITVTAVNDAPVVTATTGSMAYAENGTTAVDPTITVADSDTANMSSATVTMTTAYVNGQDTLAFTNANGITGTWTASTGTLVLSGSTTIANYQAALRSVTYNNNSHAPTTTTRTVTFKVNDGILDSNVASRTITVTAVNDAPVNSVPGTQATTKNVTKVFSAANSNVISITDLDAASSSVSVQLTATNGTISLNGTGSLTFTVGDGTADATMTFTGSITNINARLLGMSFIPTNNFTGTGTLRIVTNDQGFTGTGGALSDTDTINITVS